MKRILLVLLAAPLLAGCSQAFHFFDADAGDGGQLDAGDSGVPDAGPPDGGCTRLGECECTQSAQCPAARPSCAPDHLCVECLVHADCDGGGLCDPFTRRCITPCDAGSQCSGVQNICGDDLPRHCMACEDQALCTTPGLTHCAESVGFCVACQNDSHCAAPTPRCDRRFGTCVGCLQPADCPVGTYCQLTTTDCQPF